MRLPRFAPLTGIAFVVLLVIGFGPLGGSTPDSDSTGAKVIDYYHGHQSRQIAAIILVVLAVFFFAFFVVALRDYLRDSGGGNFFPTVALVGGVISIAGFFGAVGIHAALLQGAHDRISLAAMQALNELDNIDFFGFATPLSIMMFGIAGSVLKAGAQLPRWLGWVALIIAIAFFAGPIGFLAFLLTGVFIIVASVMMYQRRSTAATA
jgi:hypothetical protein